MAREPDDPKGASGPREPGDALDAGSAAESGGAPAPGADEAVQKQDMSVLGQLGIDLTEVAAGLTITIDG